MKNLERCPRCFHLPEVKIESTAKTTSFILFCEIHGHMAMGETLEGATENWNHYIASLVKVA